MDGYHQRFLSSMAGVGGQSSPDPRQTPPLLQQQQQQQQPPPMPMSGASVQSSYQNRGYFTGFPEPIMFNAPKAQRSRRRSSAPGLDHIKHRRTRSGCLTCRLRRVKCDETRPTCERCKKGSRECVYPEPAAPKGSSTSSSKDAGGPIQGSPTSSRGDVDDDDEMDSEAKLEPILDEEEEDDEPESATARVAPHFPPRRSSTTSSFGIQHSLARVRHGSETPSYDDNNSSPTWSTGTGHSLTPATFNFPDISWPAPGTRPDISFLPPDLQFYLRYLFDHLTCFHYNMALDPNDSFRTTLVTVALQDEALLYAEVAFAVYHHTLHIPNGRITDFLQYYDRSVGLLLNFLKRKEKGTIATLLTILQLATIEEYLGDWVNLMGHQKAAFEILSQLYNPQTIMQTPLGRLVLSWYGRFDVFTAIMGSFRVVMPPDWFSNAAAFYRSMVAAEPDNVAWKMEEALARLRLISVDISFVVSREARGECQTEEHMGQHFRITDLLKSWKETLDPRLIDASFLVGEAAIDQARTTDDVVSPFSSGALYTPPLFPVTILLCEWHSVTLSHYSQILERKNVCVPPDATEHALAICQISEAVAAWPLSPRGSLMMLQACLTIGAFFVPREPRYQSWIRRKFALLETMGYISPITVRSRMSELFQDPSCLRWWLPNDELFTPFLQSVRAYADERNAMAVTAQSEYLRQIRHVFSRMRLNGNRPGPEDSANNSDARGMVTME